MGEQIPIVGAGAALLVLLSVIGMFARTNATDRRAYWQRTADLLAQWNKTDEIWLAKLAAAQAAHARCEETVEAERKKRWQVEDELSQMRRVMGRPDEPH